MLNRCEFIGRLGRDPNTRSTQTGTRIANISLACSQRWKDKHSGEMKERTEWITVVLWDKLAEVAEKYLSKGSLCYVCGQLRTRKWTDQSGADRYSTEVIVQGYDGKLLLLDKRENGSSAHSGKAGNLDAIDDEIPF